jgi:L-threonylcarbamoyladenylate synthase
MRRYRSSVRLVSSADTSSAVAPMNIQPADEQAIEQAARRLIDGEAVAFPTETVYGLGADAASAQGVASIYRIKGRPADHPLIVHVLDTEQAAWWGELGDQGRRLADAFWPGPLTLIVRRREGAPAYACGPESTVGLRSPSHPIARRLLEVFTNLGGHGVAAPSANRFGRVSPTRANHVAEDLGDEVSLILDGGPCEVGVESTIVDLSRGTPVLLRPGGIDEVQIERVLGQAPGAPDAHAPRASGTLAAHYAPQTPLELVDSDRLTARINQLLANRTSVAVWSRLRPRRTDADVHWEPAASSAQEYARELYAMLRRLDALGVGRLLIERVPDSGQWDAVRDRLARAAATFSG